MNRNPVFNLTLTFLIEIELQIRKFVGKMRWLLLYIFSVHSVYRYRRKNMHHWEIYIYIYIRFARLHCFALPITKVCQRCIIFRSRCLERSFWNLACFFLGYLYINLPVIKQYTGRNEPPFDLNEFVTSILISISERVKFTRLVKEKTKQKSLYPHGRI